jgi:hypothetical protein
MAAQSSTKTRVTRDARMGNSFLFAAEAPQGCSWMIARYLQASNMIVQ